MFLNPSASFPAPLPSWCIEYYRWKATVQVSLVSIVSRGHRAPSRLPPLRPSSAALQDKCSQLAESLAQALQRFVFFFCIEICRSPSHHTGSPVGLGEAGGLRGPRSSSAPRAQQSLLGSKLCTPCATPPSPPLTMAMEKLASLISSPHPSSLWRAQEHRKKKKPCSYLV